MTEKKRIVILGGGESGYGSAVLAKAKGFDTFLSDRGAISPEYAEILDRYGVEYEQGGHTLDKIYSADEVIKSPGIPETAPVIKGLRERDIPVISEIEFAGRYTKGKSICITGSNGKTTTTTLIYDILRNAGYDVGLAGNIGKSLAYSVATDDKEWYVMELSSFQLDGMYDFRADIAVLLNITPDHLDRYDFKFDNYAESKMRITQNQRSEDSFIYMESDSVVSDKVTEHKPSALLLPFDTIGKTAHGAWFDETAKAITARTNGHELKIDTSRLKIIGRHNIYNVMAATLATMAAGVDEKAILDTVYGFGGVEHRMEFVAEYNDIEYINDSKATNVDSAWYALEGVSRPTVWIAGGTDKGNDYTPLLEPAKQKVRALVCMGLDNAKLVDSFTGVVPEVYDTDSLEEAMKTVAKVARKGDTVLLSPACASFDLFENYEDRGRQFKAKVAELIADKR